MISYRIAHIHEETDCDHCGYPLYVDDPAVEHNGRVYCGKACAKRAFPNAGPFLRGKLGRAEQAYYSDEPPF